MELPLDRPLQEDEERLVEQAVRRDGAAFTALYERYVDQVYRHVFYRVGNKADTEDITEEVFVRAWKAIDRFKIKGVPFYTWLLKIARNLVIDHYRKQKKHLPLEDVEYAVDGGDGPEAIVESSHERHRLREAIKKLKGERRKVILMRFIEGCSYAEIASELKKSEGAVRVIQCRALNDLRTLLTD
jgi:RNA polymerase sigma-70 factor, ECF subfamily